MDLLLEGVIPAAILAYSIASWRLKWDSRIPIAVALGLLVISAVLLAFKKEDIANSVAIVSYYCLVSGVLLQFIEFLRGEDKSKKKEKAWKGFKKGNGKKT